jgi:butyrate response factor 1
VQNNSFVSFDEVEALLHSVLTRLSLENSSNHDVSTLNQHIPHSHSSSSSSPTSSRSPSSYGAYFRPLEPGNDVSVSSAKYKTELCRAFEEQKHCRYGIKCQFAHGKSELRALNRHPKYKTDLCYAFHTTGFCSYGTRCNFIHNEHERKQHSTTQRSPMSTSEYQQFSQQRVKLSGDDSLDGLGQGSLMNDDELAHRKLLLKIARVISLLNGCQTESRSSPCQQLNTSVEQSPIDAQRFDRSAADIWTQYLMFPCSTSLFDDRVSRSSSVASKIEVSSTADSVEWHSVTSPMINNVVLHRSPVRMLPSTDSLSPPPGFPPIATSTLESESRSQSYSPFHISKLCSVQLNSTPSN